MKTGDIAWESVAAVPGARTCQLVLRADGPDGRFYEVVRQPGSGTSFDCWLVSLDGPAGVGKTIHVGSRGGLEEARALCERDDWRGSTPWSRGEDR